MSTPYYTATGNPASGSGGSSSLVRAEFTAIAAGFDLLPIMAGNQNSVLMVNAGATALTRVPQAFSLGSDFTTLGAYNLTLTATATTSIILPSSGTPITLAGTQTLTNKTFTSPAISAPAFSGTAVGGSSMSGATLTTPTLASCSFSTVTVASPVLAGTASGGASYVNSGVYGTFSLITPTLTSPTFNFMRVPSGALTLTSGQIKFNSSNQGYSTDRQLAHYEEGTFTPRLKTPGSTTYTTQTGTFTRIGNLVHVYFFITFNTVDMGADRFNFTGLPYAPWNGGSSFYQTALCYVQSLATTNRYVYAALNTGYDFFVFGESNYVVDSGATLAGNFWYMTLAQ